jgi:lincosamide and streptogramin A transport system ATP-binding/permease protein
MTLIQVSNLSFGYEGSFQNVFENVSFQMDTDWKLVFVGRNGRGKTTFLNLLMGKYPFQGKISASTQFEYFPFFVQDPDGRTQSLVEGLAPGAAGWQIEKEVSLLKLELEVLERPFTTLSNGEQTKVLLAGLFLRENRFLLIDEPTNHLDLEGRKAVADYLNAKNSFIVVSHDRSFLDACVDHILPINKANIEVQKINFSNWWQNKVLQD